MCFGKAALVVVETNIAWGAPVSRGPVPNTNETEMGRVLELLASVPKSQDLQRGLSECARSNAPPVKHNMIRRLIS